jgi:hypothetical protein
MSNAWEAMVGGPMIVSGPEILGDPAMAVAAGAVATEADKSVAKYVAEAGYTASDRIVVGIGAPRTLAAGASATFETQVNTPFKPESVCVPSWLQPGLVVTAVIIGPTNLVDGDAIDTTRWSEVSLQARVSWPTADTSQKIIIRLTNNDTVAKTNVSVSLYGVRLRK